MAGRLPNSAGSRSSAKRRRPALDFLWQPVEQFNDAAALVWLAGLVGFAFWKRFADLRLFAIAFVAFFAAMIIFPARPITSPTRFRC